MADLGGHLERAIMEVLWAAREPLRIREVMGHVNAAADRALAYNTVQTVAERLTRKGMLVRSRDGQAFRYAPTRSRDDHTLALIREALTDSPDQAAVLILLAERLDPADARRVIDALRRRTER